jgi:hypothetical protein
MLKGVEKRLAALNRECKWRQTAATASDKRRHIAASSLPLFAAPVLRACVDLYHRKEMVSICQTSFPMPRCIAICRSP